MRICPIGSGSSGNCTYIGSDTTHILIDAGLSCKRITEGVQALGLSMTDISGIFITHEHSDHVKALPLISKKYGIPIYGTEG
ncbi:MAG: MBL fold metallo-hydrolase, partial [Lachnospiraceae bacterium]|nr:MBL fold metallo-hydrolase [Lachnospiraceae bacterium]